MKPKILQKAFVSLTAGFPPLLKDCNYTNQKFNGSPLLPIALVLVCFALLPRAQAVVPAPDGGYGPPAYGTGNTAEGQNALFSLTTGTYNTAIGFNALHSDTIGRGNTATGLNALYSNTTGNFNTGVGAATLLANTASENTATGAGALLNNTTSSNNTANGAFALNANTTGSGNTATGASALFSNRTGGANTAVGWRALFDNTSGGGHTAVGYSALKNTIASGEFTGNTAVGTFALFNDTTGNGNVAVGWGAGLSLTTGSSNTATGTNALISNTGGSGNTATGAEALRDNTTGGFNTAVGRDALHHNTTGDSNTGLGDGAGYSITTGDFNTLLGGGAGYHVGTASGVICIGANVFGSNVSNSCFIGNIWNKPGGSQAVYVNSDGKLGAQVSSRRFKDEIQPMNQASEAIHRLRPVSFRYKAEVEPTRPIGFGLIAEEVEKINPDLVTRDKEGKPLSVRYDAVNAMLLNEFLKEHKAFTQEQRKVQEQEVTITQLKQDFQSTLAEQQKQIEALTAGLQKVSAQLEASKPAPQTVKNDD